MNPRLEPTTKAGPGPDLFVEPISEFVGYERIQIRLAELKAEGATIYSMAVKRGGYHLSGRHNRNRTETQSRLC